MPASRRFERAESSQDSRYGSLSENEDSGDDSVMVAPSKAIRVSSSNGASRTTTSKNRDRSRTSKTTTSSKSRDDSSSSRRSKKDKAPTTSLFRKEDPSSSTRSSRVSDVRPSKTKARQVSESEHERRPKEGSDSDSSIEIVSSAAPVTRKKDSRTSKAQVAKGTDRERGRSSKSSIKRPRSPSADREEAETAIGSRKVSAQQKSTNVSEPASKRPKKQRDTSRADSADDKTEQSDEEVAASLAPRRADGKTKAHNPSSRDKARRAKNASSRHDEEDSYGESAADSNDSDVVEVAVSKEPPPKIDTPSASIKAKSSERPKAPRAMRAKASKDMSNEDMDVTESKRSRRLPTPKDEVETTTQTAVTKVPAMKRFSDLADDSEDDYLGAKPSERSSSRISTSPKRKTSKTTHHTSKGKGRAKDASVSNDEDSHEADISRPGRSARSNVGAADQSVTEKVSLKTRGARRNRSASSGPRDDGQDPREASRASPYTLPDVLSASDVDSEPEYESRREQQQQSKSSASMTVLPQPVPRRALRPGLEDARPVETTSLRGTSSRRRSTAKDERIIPRSNDGKDEKASAREAKKRAAVDRADEDAKEVASSRQAKKQAEELKAEEDRLKREAKAQEKAARQAKREREEEEARLRREAEANATIAAALKEEGDRLQKEKRRLEKEREREERQREKEARAQAAEIEEAKKERAELRKQQEEMARQLREMQEQLRQAQDDARRATAALDKKRKRDELESENDDEEVEEQRSRERKREKATSRDAKQSRSKHAPTRDRAHRRESTSRRREQEEGEAEAAQESESEAEDLAANRRRSRVDSKKSLSSKATSPAKLSRSLKSSVPARDSDEEEDSDEGPSVTVAKTTGSRGINVESRRTARDEGQSGRRADARRHAASRHQRDDEGPQAKDEISEKHSSRRDKGKRSSRNRDVDDDDSLQASLEAESTVVAGREGRRKESKEDDDQRRTSQMILDMLSTEDGGLKSDAEFIRSPDAAARRTSPSYAASRSKKHEDSRRRASPAANIEESSSFPEMPAPLEQVKEAVEEAAAGPSRNEAAASPARGTTMKPRRDEASISVEPDRQAGSSTASYTRIEIEEIEETDVIRGGPSHRQLSHVSGEVSSPATEAAHVTRTTVNIEVEEIEVDTDTPAGRSAHRHARDTADSANRYDTTQDEIRAALAEADDAIAAAEASISGNAAPRSLNNGQRDEGAAAEEILHQALRQDRRTPPRSQDPFGDMPSSPAKPDAQTQAEALAAPSFGHNEAEDDDQEPPSPQLTGLRNDDRNYQDDMSMLDDAQGGYAEPADDDIEVRDPDADLLQGIGRALDQERSRDAGPSNVGKHTRGRKSGKKAQSGHDDVPVQGMSDDSESDEGPAINDETSAPQRSKARKTGGRPSTAGRREKEICSARRSRRRSSEVYESASRHSRRDLYYNSGDDHISRQLRPRRSVNGEGRSSPMASTRSHSASAISEDDCGSARRERSSKSGSPGKNGPTRPFKVTTALKTRKELPKRRITLADVATSSEEEDGMVVAKSSTLDQPPRPRKLQSSRSPGGQDVLQEALSNEQARRSEDISHSHGHAALGHETYDNRRETPGSLERHPNEGKVMSNDRDGRINTRHKPSSHSATPAYRRTNRGTNGEHDDEDDDGPTFTSRFIRPVKQTPPPGSGSAERVRSSPGQVPRPVVSRSFGDSRPSMPVAPSMHEDLSESRTPSVSPNKAQITSHHVDHGDATNSPAKVPELEQDRMDVDASFEEDFAQTNESVEDAFTQELEQQLATSEAAARSRRTPDAEESPTFSSPAKSAQAAAPLPEITAATYAALQPSQQAMQDSTIKGGSPRREDVAADSSRIQAPEVTTETVQETVTTTESVASTMQAAEEATLQTAFLNTEHQDILQPATVVTVEVTTTTVTTVPGTPDEDGPEEIPILRGDDNVIAADDQPVAGPSGATTATTTTSSSSTSSSDVDAEEASDDPESSAIAPAPGGASGQEDASDEDDEDDEDDGETPPFNHDKLVAWVETLKDNDTPTQIGAEGLAKLFEGSGSEDKDTGLQRPILAWKLDGSFFSARFTAYMVRHRIDDAPKLFRHLDGVKRETFAISSHTRFASTLDGDDSVSISVKTFHVPEGYEDFYRFCFDFLMEPSADVLSMNHALMAWELVLTDHFPIGRGLIDYMTSQASRPETVDRDLWLQVLEFCKTVQITELASGKSVFTGYDGRNWSGLISDYMDSVRAEATKPPTEVQAYQPDPQGSTGPTHASASSADPAPAPASASPEINMFHMLG